MPFACLYIPDWPAQALLRLEAEAARERPFAVLEGEPPLTFVASANAAARRAGVELGMPRAQAEQLPNVTLRRRSPAQEDSAHQALVDCALGLSPRVESTAPGVVTLDLAGLETLFGPPEKIARALAERAATLGLEGRVGVAANPEAAETAARGFAGITVLSHDAEHAARQLGTLAVDVLLPAPEALATLERWGVRTLRALALLPSPALSERLGQDGLRLQRRARAESWREIVPVEPPLDFTESLELEHPVELLEPLCFLLNRMLEQLCARLASRALATNELRVELSCQLPEGDQLSAVGGRRTSVVSRRSLVVGQNTNPNLCHSEPKRSEGEESAFSTQDSQLTTHHSKLTTHNRSLRLPVPMLDAKIFLKLLHLDLQSHPPAAPVERVTLALEPVRPRPAQGGLFLPDAPAPERLELTLARLRGVVGEKDGEPRIGQAVLLDTHRPDAFRVAPFAPPPPQPGNTGRPPAQTTLAGLRLFRPPQPVRVGMKDGAPAWVLWEGARRNVIGCAGPWRSSGEWWASAPWARDEWDVEIEDTGAFFRLVHDLLREGWWMEGEYD